MINRLLIEIRDVISIHNYENRDNYTVLKKVLQKMLAKAYDSESIFSDLFSNVVYIVLNRAPLNNPDERVFLAGICEDNLNKKVLNRILNIENDNTHFDYANAFLINAKGKERIEDKIRNYWLYNWGQYYDSTKNITEYTTLNQSLLKHVEHSLNLGFYWGEKDKSTNEEYFYIPKSLIEKLGFDVKSNDWHFRLLEKQTYFDPDIKIETNEEIETIKKIKEIYQKMIPKKIELFNDKGILYILFHLLRSYAFWGGNSFISIPISFGIRNKGSEQHSAVLSLCTTEPLNQTDYYKWTLIANKVFKELIFDDVSKILEYENQKERVTKSYNMGHFLKNRVNPMMYVLNELERLFDSSPIISEQLDNSVIDEIYQFINPVIEQTEKLNNVGYLMDLVSLALKTPKDKNKIFLSNSDRIKRYTRKEQYDISKSLEKYKLFKYATEPGEDQVSIIKSIPRNLFINPFFGNNKEYRPLDAIYDELIIEIMINVSKYAKVDSNNEKVVTIYVDNKNILFQNLIKHDKYNSLKDKLNRWTSSKVIFNETGGLYYVVDLLERIDAGNVKVKVEKKNKKYYFNIAIEFKGFTYEKK